MIKELESQYDKLKKIDTNLLRREGKDYDFNDIYPLMREAYNNWLLLENNETCWNLFPSNIKTNIISSFNEYLSILESIKRFDPKTMNPKAERDNLAVRLNNAYTTMYNLFYASLKINNLEMELQNANFQALIESFQNKADSLIDSLEKKEKNADEIINAMKIVSAETGVSKYAEVFKEQADKNRNMAIGWLIVSLASAVGIGSFLWWIINQLLVTIEKGIDFQISIQIFIAKVLLLSFFSVIFYQIVKNYNANMHLYTLNKHRENSLKTFQSFVQASNDPKTKDAVLIQATKSIFESGDTGYISSKDTTISGFEITRITDQIGK
jgi:hypothetical protein